jgi:hypothetical protein
MKSCKPWRAAMLVFLALSLFDAVIGGAISAVLRINGWTAIDQRLNDVYHVNYALIITAALIWHYSYFKRLVPVFAVAILFLGYVEDTLFYCFTPLINPVIKMLTKGEALQLASGALWPQHISGWIGWLGRAGLSRNFAFAMPHVLALNAIAVGVAIFLFCIKCKATDRPTKS